MHQMEESLPRRAKQGDESALAALIAHFMPVIRKGAAACAAPGLEFEDAVQEGLIGLFNAVRSYDAAKSGTFPAYAARCILHAQQDARRAALRKKHAPLNYGIPLPEDGPAADPGPEELAIAGEEYTDTVRRLKTLLSPLERRVLLQSLHGRTAAQIAAALGIPSKTVSNALTRARRKLRG